MKYVIASKILPSDIVYELKALGIECLQLWENPLISNETKYHPDMMFYKLTTGELLCSDKTPLVHKLDTFVKLLHSQSTPRDGYPMDCIFNCFFAKNCLFCGDSTASEIIEDALKAGLDICRVKQGYAACSTVKITDKAFISSDKGIVKALISKGNDALLVSNNGILLNGYSNGFIGGCALTTESYIAFTGNVEKHGDYNNIKSFISNYNKRIISLSKNTLYDYGGFILL